MRNPQSNPQPSSSIDLTRAKPRASLARLAALARGLKPLHVFLAVALVGPLVATSLFMLSNLGKRSPKTSPTLSAFAVSETNALPAQAKLESKQSAIRAEKKHVSQVRNAEAKPAAKEENEPAKPHVEGAILTSAPQSAPPVQSIKEAGEEEDSDTARLRASWFFDQRAYPNQHIPAGALQKAIEQRDLMRQQQRAAFKPGPGPQAVVSFPGDALWHLMGPAPVNTPFGQNSGFPTASGRVTAIAVDPTNASIVYIGGAAGGVWKTTNGGNTWAVLTDNQPSLAVGSITIDPNSCSPGPCTTIYVGTGEENFNGDAFYGAGILKSINGGTTWTQLGASTFAQQLGPAIGGAYIGAIAVQPGNANIVLAAVSFIAGGTIGGIYRSADAGTTWTEVSAGTPPIGIAATGVVFEPTSVAGTTAIAYAAMGWAGGDAHNGIYKSTDSGVTWSLLAGGLPTTNLGRITLGYAPSTSGGGATLYAAIANSLSGSNNLLGLFKTTNGGGAWSSLTSPGSANGFCAPQCFYDMAIGVQPTNASVLVLGGGPGPNNFTSLFESTNGGTSWTPASAAAGDFAFGSDSTHVHVDTHAIVFSATGTTLYVGNDGGIWSTITPTPASGVSPTWVDLNPGLAITQFYPGPSAAVSDENYGFGGTQDNDTELFQNSLTWQNEFVCGDGGFTAIDQRTPTTVYTGCDAGAGSKIKKAVMNGQFLKLANTQQLPGFDVAETAITNSGDRMQFIPPIALDDSNPNNLYFGTCRVWQTTNAASSLANSFIPVTPTWTAISGDLSINNEAVTKCPATTPLPGAGNITNLEVAHSNSSVIVAGTTNGKVWETTTGGALWTEIDAGALPGRHVTAVRTKRSDSTGAIVYVTFSGFDCGGGCGPVGHVFKTTTAGTTNTWTNISGDLPDIPVNDIIVDHNGSPAHDALYVATDVGVFACPDPEAASPCTNWTVIGDGLPNSPVLGLAMRRSSRILRASTHGRSTWQIQLTDVNPPSLVALSSITPAAVNVGATSTAATVTGVNFSTNTQVQFAGSTTGVTTTFVNTTQLNVTLSSTLFTVGGVFPISLTDPAGVDSGSSLLAGGGGPFAVMNPLVDPLSMTPTTAQTYAAVPFHLTSATSTEPFLPNTILAFYDTSNPPVLQFQLPTVPTVGTVSSGGTVYDLTTAVTQFTTPFTYQVVPYNPTPGGGIDDLAITAAGAGGPVPFTFTVTPNPNPLAIVSPNPIALSAALGTTSPVLTISITNPGGAALNITAQSITGTNSANFAFAAPGFGTTCNFPTSGQAGTGTITLTAGGGTCNFGMTYFANPATPGNAVSNATLILTDNGSGNPQAIPITGTPFTAGLSGVVLFPVNFGAVPIGTTSATMNSTLFNATAATVTVSSPGLAISGGANPGDFHIVSFVANGDGFPACSTTLPFALTSFAGCDVSLTFTPTVVGNESSTITATDDGPGSPQNAALIGAGVQITSISPSIVATGGPAFTLRVNGGGFAPSAVVNVSSINGTNVLPRLTTFVSANQLLASIPASDIATSGSLAITVTTPVPGGTTSEPKTLIVAQATVSTNDNITFATSANTPPFRTTQDTTQATVDTGTPPIPDPTPAPACVPGTATQSGKARSVWFTATPPVSGRVVFDTRFSSYPTILSAWTGTPGSLVSAGGCVSGNVPGAVPASQIVVNVPGGTKFFLMVSDASATGAGGTLTFSLDFQATAPANDDNATPTVIAAAPFANSTNNIQATPNTNGHLDPALPAGCATGAASAGQANSIWYKFTAPGNGTITADTLTSPYDTILNVTSGTPVGAQVACNNDAAAGIAQSQVSFAATSATTYFFMVSSFLGDGGTTNFHLTFSAGVAGVPATITATSGTPQSTTISTAFAAPLVATVKDSFSNPVSGANVTFTAPGAGASGKFSNNTATITIVTNASGVASAPITANATSGGPYTVTATVPGVATPANFSLTNNAGAAASMTANAGTTPQSATISTAFANALAVTVKDAGSNPVSGVNVTFTAPGSGASGKFSNNTATITIATNASGVASAPFTANATAGGPYTVTATATGLTTVNFSLTNTAGAAASMTANAGTTPQSATISTAFANALAVTVKDAGSNPVSGVNVTFTAPGSGASGVFSNSTATITVATNASGVASAPFTANATAGGPYTVTAAATGLTTVNFSLTNTAGAAASMTANAGTTPQSATISTAFANALAVTVKDAGSNPVSGVNVTFTAPGSGASGKFSNNTATITVATNASGVASAPFTANATAGGPYTVTAAATGLTTVNFSLTNTAGAAASMTANAATTPQSATISTAFANALAVTVKDAGSNPVSGVNVTFTAPGSGASGVFSNSTATITVATNASGVASAPFTANATAGGPYTVTAAATGLTTVNFSLTNTAGAAASMTANAGTTPQSATISTAFANALAVTVKDAGSNPVSGVNVTFTAPGSGASGVFSNSTATITVATNASGVASAPLTANATSGGPYTVTAAATGVTTVNFSLTNLTGAAGSMTANAGTTPQSATISTAFANALAVTVKDAGSNPVSGVNVTFTAPGSGASGAFSNSTATITVATNTSGVASAPFTANTTAGGPYSVTAAATGLATVNFSLTNTVGAAASMTANAGTTPQSATVNTAFANALAVTVKDAGSNPVFGVNVTFTAPGSGASGKFSNNTATITVATNASGVASAPFTANGTAAGPYTVTAAATGLTTVNFSLTNTAGAAAKVAATSGTPQSASINTAFALPLVATVTDSGNNPVSGVVVTFTPPGSGASGTFAGGVNTATTNASGVATSGVFTANGTAGGPYNIVASATGATSANFALTNTAVPPGKVAITSGSGQNTAISTAFAAPLVVTVTDATNNPVSGVVVTFTPPAGGASGTFAGGVNTATTNALGVATSAAFTANSTAGSYNVVASAPNDTSANFAMTNTAGPAAKITATSGTPQSAVINAAFAAPLVATVTDAGNNPVSGVVVTFTPPAGGASGAFAGGVSTATTNASGVATSATFTANATAGGPYNVVASATGATSANYALTNTAGPAAKVTATSGSGQNAAISTAFAAPLVATVTDAGNNPVSGALVTFTPPAGGASGSFAGGVNTATTNASGAATSAVFTANATAGGPYNVVASATGAISANFALTNNTGPAAKVAATSGTPQSAAINVAFGAPLVATVTDAGNNPVSGVVVTFTPPASGASGAFAGGVNTATTNASGVATSAVFTANATAGGPYNVVASATGATSANFSLTNLTGTPATVSATAGTPQAAPINTAFTTQLQATVKDAGSNPVSGVVVTFTAPASGASGTFAGGVNTATTNASGVATAPVFTANGSVGAYTVTATVSGVAAPANFLLTNNAGPAATITPTAGTPQNATINTAFATLLQATVKDAGGNPVNGVVVTFAAPASGASGAFTGGVTTATTNSSGVATAAVFTANGTAGSYTVTAKVSGVATAANFSLTNNPGPPAIIAATAGTPQSATINTAFATQLQATVKDAGGNLVSGAIVTFAAPAAGASGAFAGGVTTATTNANGIATAALFTANATAGTYTVTAKVTGVAAPANFSLTNNNPVPTVTSLVPTSQTAGSGTFLLTINGTNFVSGATVTFGSDPTALVPVTNTGTVITVNIPAADLATGGMFPVVVTNPGPGGGPSAVTANSTFIVNNPVPTVGNAAVAGKTHISGGAAFTLTVTGTNFVSNSVVNFNGNAVTTHFGTATQLTADIPASAVAKAGNVNVTVTNPAPAGGTSAPPFVFTVDGFTVGGPANTNVTDGKVAMIEIDVTPTANGFTNAVTFNVTGLPKNTSFVFVPTSVTPNGAVGKTILQVTTKASSVVPPSSPFERPPSPLLRLLPIVWIAALLAGIYAMLLLRRTPQLKLRRYAAIVPLALLLLTGAVLAGCAGKFTGTPKGAAPLVVTATSGTMSQTANVTLTVQ